MPKYSYKFCDGTISEVEVSDEHYALLKSKLTSSNVVETIQTTHDNAKIILNIGYDYCDGKACYNKDCGNQRPFIGIFAYESEDLKSEKLIESERVKTALRNNNGFLNHIVFGKDTFVKYWGHNSPDGYKNDNPFYRFYKIQDLAFGFFISNLLDSIIAQTTNKQVTNTTYQRAFYPIEKENSLYNVPDVICSFTVDNPSQRSISRKNQTILQSEETLVQYLIKRDMEINKGKTKNKEFYCISKINIEERYDFQKFCQAFNARGYSIVNNLELQDDDIYFIAKHGDEKEINLPYTGFRKEDLYF